MNTLKSLLCAFIVLSAYNNFYAQDSLKIVSKSDSIEKKFRTKVKFSPSPKKALLLGLVLPGAGQAYNRQWWKMPIVYAGIGGMGYLSYFNYTEYRRFKVAREALLEMRPNAFPGISSAALKSNRDFYRKNFELNIVGFGLVYVLQAVEAFTAAHLKTFDVSDDLSLYIIPQQTPTGLSTGLTLNWTMGTRSKYKQVPTVSLY